MALTLGNPITNQVVSDIRVATKRSDTLGASLTTGQNLAADVIDGYLGNSLRDNEIVLGAVAKNTAYSINLLNITDQYMNTIASTLQEGLKTIASAGPLSSEKLAVLKQSIDDKRAQIGILINTATFDGKDLLAGEAKDIAVQIGTSAADKLTVSVKDIAVQIGTSAADKLTVSVKDISSGKLFRSAVTNAVNSWIKSQGIASCAYYANATELATAVSKNSNFIHNAATNAAGGGTGGAMADAAIAAAFIAIRTANPQIFAGLDKALPVATAFIATTAAGAGTTWQDMDAVNFAGTLGNAGARAEILAFLQDNVATTLTTDSGRVVSQNVFQSALNDIRAEQAKLANQKGNVEGAAEAVRSTTNVTQKAADSYIKTDYVKTAQEYSELIKKIVAAVTTLQAANKTSDAAQRLIDGLAR